MSTSPTPSLTPSRSPTPVLAVQPDHFYGAESTQQPLSPNSVTRTWLDPADDPLAHRGIPVFKPTMEEFADFEGYMSKIECWGLRSGIVKVIPPQEWVDALPHIKDQLATVKIRSPIEQHMLGRGGLFRQENVEKRKVMSVREWAELCSKEEFRTPGVEDVGLHARSLRADFKLANKRRPRPASRKMEASDLYESRASLVNEELSGVSTETQSEPISPPPSVGNPQTPNTSSVDPQLMEPDFIGEDQDVDPDDGGGAAILSANSSASQEKSKSKGKRVAQTREAREASLAERATKDRAFLEVFDPRRDWLPPNTVNDDYTLEFCQKLERQYWRNCGLGKSAWYGADMQGSLYTDETNIWNVAHLPSFLSRILPVSSKGLPGVNTPYLYFGMWRATFAWHVEDMDLFSINYIHFGAPKFWYAVPQGRAAALESTMRGYFPKDVAQCPQFLRHKSFLASPTLLAQSSCRPNFLVQREREFVITYPRGYHAGFNLGFNCAESVNFALESWLELGRRAQVCQCVSDSVRIDVDQLLQEREKQSNSSPSSEPKKRKSDGLEGERKMKRPKVAESSTRGPVSSSGITSKVSVTLKLPSKPAIPEDFPCCLCVSASRERLLRVHDPPIGRRELPDSLASVFDVATWMAHEDCAKVVPETWVDEVDVETNADIDGTTERMKERRVFGVDAIVKDRWNLKCAACTKWRHKAHGAPIQCTKGKCAKSFHVSCARQGTGGIAYAQLREVEKEVVLVDSRPPITPLPDQELRPDESRPPVMSTTEPRVLKTITKYEVQVLCAQHNPEVAAAKKARQQDKIRNELLALPPMSRIKIRVSAGVFEVSLVRIIEETKSVEVLWDRGIKREFKWGSVVLGPSDDQTVVQKPSEPAPSSPQPTQKTSTYPVPVMSTAALPSSSTTTPVPSISYISTQPQMSPPGVYGIGPWSYSVPGFSHPYHPSPYSSLGYYQEMMQSHHPPANSSNTAHAPVSTSSPVTLQGAIPAPAPAPAPSSNT